MYTINHFKHLHKAPTTVTLFIAILLLLLSNAFSENASSKNKPVYVIPVSGDVDPGMSAFIKRAVNDVPETPEPLIIFEMDTFGGRVDSALQIVETLSGITHAKTVAFVKTKAISAGALIALACNELAMRHNTTIGDCAPITYSDDGPKMLGEKFQSPLRAKFRALAKKNEYNETLAEAMVSADLEIYRVEMGNIVRYLDSIEFEELSKKEKSTVTSKKTVVKKGELLTMDNTEAVDLGFSRVSVSSVQEFIESKGITDYSLHRMEKQWSESFVAFIISITPILMMIGLAAVYTEIKAPGFGAPGIVGIICLSLAFGSQYAVGLANYTELLMILLGIVLLGIELFVIPGFGIAGIAGFLFIGVGMVLSLQDFTIPEPSFPWQGELMMKNITVVLGSYLVSFIGAILILRYVLPRFSISAEGPYLTGTLSESHADSLETQNASVGDEGIAMSLLRPSGKMKIGNERFDVITEGEYIEKGTPVVITRIRGNQLIVSRKE